MFVRPERPLTAAEHSKAASRLPACACNSVTRLNVRAGSRPAVRGKRPGYRRFGWRAASPLQVRPASEADVPPMAWVGRLRTGSFGVCNRDKQKFVVGTVDGKSRPIVSKQAHRGDKAGRLIRSPVHVVQRLLATEAVGAWILARRRDTDFFQHNRPCVDLVEQAVRSACGILPPSPADLTAYELPMRRALWPPCLWRGPRPRWQPPNFRSPRPSKHGSRDPTHS